MSLKEEQDVNKLNALCQVCCQYNKEKTFNPLRCNSFHFVKDALSALSIPHNSGLPDNQLGKLKAREKQKQLTIFTAKQGDILVKHGNNCQKNKVNQYS